MKALPPKKAKFLELLLEGLPYVEAGKRLGVSPATAWRWWKDPAVQLKLHEAQEERLRVGYMRITLALQKAIETLERLCEHRSGYVAVQAAKALLDTILKLREQVELERRLEAIERKLEELEGGHVKGKVEIA